MLGAEIVAQTDVEQGVLFATRKGDSHLYGIPQ